MPDLNLEKMVSVFIKMRAKRAALKQQYDEEDGKIKEAQEKIQSALLDYCKTNNIESGRTEAGTFYRKVSTKYWTNDWESFGKFVVENNMPDLLERRINQTHMRELLKDQPELVPPGLNAESKYEVIITKPRNKASD